MSIKKQHYCPICKKELRINKRYPNYVCRDCADKTTDISGRNLSFSNTSILGGFDAYYSDTEEKYDGHICYINGIKCYADEARFGGIVIETINPDSN